MILQFDWSVEMRPMKNLTLLEAELWMYKNIDIRLGGKTKLTCI